MWSWWDVPNIKISLPPEQDGIIDLEYFSSVYEAHFHPCCLDWSLWPLL